MTTNKIFRQPQSVSSASKISVVLFRETSTKSVQFPRSKNFLLKSSMLCTIFLISQRFVQSSFAVCSIFFGEQIYCVVNRNRVHSLAR